MLLGNSMTEQINITLSSKSQGIHLVTDEIMSRLPKIPKAGLMNIFIKYTSCALSINENCDPAVRGDMKAILDRLVPENQPYYEHTLEGSDDMPAHAKASLIGSSITIPITDGHLNLGIWQGIYLCEFRRHGGARNIVVTIIS
jgi:secondary thiamine-phosphate synthase enzyme